MTDLATAPFDFARRRRVLSERLDERGIDVLFLPADQADFEYYTGVPRRAPSFGSIAYTNHWISGAFLAPGEDPLFVLTRHFQEFDLPDGIDGEVVTAIETDDGRAVFQRAYDRFRALRRELHARGRRERAHRRDRTHLGPGEHRAAAPPARRRSGDRR